MRLLAAALLTCSIVWGGAAPQAALGRYLFYDKRISVNGQYSCASCHKQELAFTDGRAQALGATGQLHPRSAMSLVNLATATAFNWANPTVHSLEEQALKPMFGKEPVEMGVDKTRLLQLIRTDAMYKEQFPKAFPSPDPWTLSNVAKALAAFERTIVSNQSPYDRYHRGGDATAISDAAKRGEMLFFLDGLSCFRCHAGPDFTGRPRDEYHNTALYDPYAAPNIGLTLFTKRTADTGKFKAPTLRNIALTAPYMHDGSVPTLDAVLDHYAAGGRAHGNAQKDKLMTGFDLTPLNRADLIAFLGSLTDESLIHNPALSNPW